MTLASAALLLAASQLDRLEWAAQMVGVDDRMAALAVRAWKCNREVRQMAQRLEPQIRRVVQG